MPETKDGQFVSQDLATLNHPNLFQARAFKGKNGQPQGEAKFDANLELAPDSKDVPRIKAAAVVVARAKWPGRDFKTDFQFPFHSGDKLADRAQAKGKDREHSRGKLVLVARSQFAPHLAVIESGEVVGYEDDRRPLCKEAFYPGVRVGYRVTFAAYDGVGSNPDGVNAYLDYLVSTKKGERIKGAGTTAAEVFKHFAGVLSSEDPTASNVEDSDIAV